MSAVAVASDDLGSLRTQIEDLERENKRLRKELRDEEERAKDAENERDDLQREVNEYESHERKAQHANFQALAHARTVLQTLDTPDAFTRTMNERAVDAITELIGR